MFDRIRDGFAPPVFEDEDETRVARLLNVILLTVFAVALLLTLFSGLLGETSACSLAIGMITAFLALVMWFGMRRGRVRWVGVLLASVLLVNVTGGVYFGGSIRTPLTTAYVLCILVAGLAVTQAAAAGQALSRIQEKGELVLGTSGNMPSMSQKLGDGSVVGFDVDLARLMASGMGVNLKINTMPFNELLTALQKGEVDVVISNMTMNPERNMTVAFVGPYMTSGKCVLTRRVTLCQTLG